MEQYEQELMQYQDYVYEIARSVREHVPANVELGDLVQYGQIGLMEALKKYDAGKGVTFKTFAYRRIKGAIYDGLHVATQHLQARYYKRKFRQMCADIMYSEENHAVPESIHNEIMRLKHIIRMLTQAFVISLDTISEIGINDSPEQHLISKELNERLQKSLATLSERESQIIYLYYYKGYSLARAGAMIGITRSWASRLHARAILQLQEEMSKYYRQE